MMNQKPSEADRKAAAKFVSELDAAGKLADPRKALEILMALSLSELRAAKKRSAVPRGDTVKLADGTVVRVEKDGVALAVWIGGRKVYSVAAPK
jgi:hypothetical protein